MGPPKEVGPRSGPHPEPRNANTNYTSGLNIIADKTTIESLAAIRRRPYKPSTGLRASGFREGFGRGLLWVQREFHEHLDEIGQARLAAVVARSEADGERPSANDVERGRRLCQ
jgi:hypothetical protein